MEHGLRAVLGMWMLMALFPFHLAFPIRDIESTRRFYVELLGCAVGREAERWIDFDFYGHQISAHVVERPESHVPTNPVDGKDVPVRHFGAVLPMGEWERLRDRLQAADVEFLIAPYVRFRGEVGEQATMFVLDPSGNGLEFKAFADPSRLFAT